MLRPAEDRENWVRLPGAPPSLMNLHIYKHPYPETLAKYIGIARKTCAGCEAELELDQGYVLFYEELDPRKQRQTYTSKGWLPFDVAQVTRVCDTCVEPYEALFFLSARGKIIRERSPQEK